jgi:hypothetical protein
MDRGRVGPAGRPLQSRTSYINIAIEVGVVGELSEGGRNGNAQRAFVGRFVAEGPSMTASAGSSVAASVYGGGRTWPGASSRRPIARSRPTPLPVRIPRLAREGRRATTRRPKCLACGVRVPAGSRRQ